MTKSAASGTARSRTRGAFSELIKIQGTLALREPYWLAGLILPTGLIVLFWAIGVASPGNVSGTDLTVLELYLPTLIVISYLAIALIGLPVTFARDREIGWLRRVSTTPVHPSRLLAAQLVLNLLVALAATVMMVAVGSALLGSPLSIGIGFVGVATLAVFELFSLGLVVAALAPSQAAANGMAGGLFFVMIFLAGLWIQPQEVGGPLATIMVYSPAGAAVRALLSSIFNSTPQYGAVVAMAGWGIVLGYLAVRFFRWE
jgi:ABC-2 type transport system permease protein